MIQRWVQAGAFSAIHNGHPGRFKSTKRAYGEIQQLYDYICVHVCAYIYIY